jgi:hypothetical protein
MDNHHSVQTISCWCCGYSNLSAEKQQQFFDKNIVTINFLIRYICRLISNLIFFDGF